VKTKGTIIFHLKNFVILTFWYCLHLLLWQSCKTEAVPFQLSCAALAIEVIQFQLSCATSAIDVVLF
jgi:hypothetical protein